MGRMSVILAGAALAAAAAGAALADTPRPAIEPVVGPVAARAHLVFRVAPHARPIEGQVTVLQPTVAAAADPSQAPAPQVQITIVQIDQT